MLQRKYLECGDFSTISVLTVCEYNNSIMQEMVVPF